MHHVAINTWKVTNSKRRMHMYKTFVLPPDQSMAQVMFNDIIRKNPFVLLVVLGMSSEAQQLITIGDLVAGGANNPSWRRVVWVQYPEQLQSLINGLTVKAGVPNPLTTQMYGFFVDFNDSICGAIVAPQRIAKGPIIQGFFAAESSS